MKIFMLKFDTLIIWYQNRIIYTHVPQIDNSKAAGNRVIILTKKKNVFFCENMFLISSNNAKSKC